MNITDSSDEWQDGLTSNTICVVSIWKLISTLVFLPCDYNEEYVNSLMSVMVFITTSVTSILGIVALLWITKLILLIQFRTFEWQNLCKCVAHGKDENFSTQLAGRNKTISPFQGPLLRTEISRKSEIWAWIDDFIHKVLSFAFINHVLISIVV